MLTKSDIIKIVKKFSNHHQCSLYNIVLGAGSALCMYGLKKTTNDIDVEIPEELFNEFISSKEGKLVFADGKILCIDLDNGLSLHKANKRKRITQIMGIACCSLEDILDLKLRLNRPKDQEDIKLLESILDF